MKRLITLIAMMLIASTGNASGWKAKTKAGFNYVNATMAAASEEIMATNVTANIAGAETDIVGLGPVLHLNVWLSGGEWPIDVAFNHADGLPIEFFVRWRDSAGTWNYDGYLLPGLGTAFYRIPLPTLGLASDDLEIVVNNPRATRTGNVRIWGNVSQGSVSPQFVPQQLSSVITPAGSAVASRAYASYCFRRPQAAAQVRWYAAAVDGTATQLVSTGFYRPSYSEDGAYWGALISSATSPHRWTIAGELVCMVGYFAGTFDDAATASYRFSVAVGPYAP